MESVISKDKKIKSTLQSVYRQSPLPATKKMHLKMLHAKDYFRHTFQIRLLPEEMSDLGLNGIHDFKGQKIKIYTTVCL